VTDEFDYIIVGAGAAGSTLAHELSMRTHADVLVLESGGPATSPLIRIPKGFYFLYGTERGKKYSFYYDTNPLPQTGEPERWQRGRVDGGSTSLNGTQYDRGSEAFWDSVADKTDARWSWEEVLKTFKSLENHELGASDMRGGSGPLSITVSRPAEPLNDAIVAAFREHGIPWVDDLNARGGERIGYIPNTIKNGWRHNTDRAFLRPALKRKNVTRIHHAHAVRVIFDGKRATGIEVLVKNQRRLFRAKQEVILCAGSLETPLLLERSGIGQPEILREIGAPTIVENSHVGEHAVEQRNLFLSWSINKQMGYSKKLSTKLQQMRSGIRWLLTRKGVIGTGAYDLGGFAKSDRSLPDPDIFLIINPFLMAPEGGVDAASGFHIIGYQVTPSTESSIHATSMDPFAAPKIDARYLESEQEQIAQHRILEIAREIVAEHPLSKLISEETAPGSAVQTREEAIAYSWPSGHLLHAMGTARMGAGEDSVVDPSLRVRGVEGLRVADGSVLPAQPGNTMAPSILIGAHAARIITGELTAPASTMSTIAADVKGGQRG
jgi:choline dehydrogenase-like flavoprotein